jgi:hypothetical protein
MILTHEDGNIVLRDATGKLYWSKHIVDLSEPAEEIHFEGVIHENIYNTGRWKETEIEPTWKLEDLK